MKLQRKNILCLGLLCLFLLLNTTQGIAQNTDSHLTGHVLDELTGEHLPFVTVQLKGTNIGTVTDESGHFLLTNLPLGEQTIIFSYVGYETKEQPVVVISNMTTEIKVSIHEKSHLLNNVVVTANRYATKQQEVATIVNVISPLVIESTTSNSMADLLQLRRTPSAYQWIRRTIHSNPHGLTTYLLFPGCCLWIGAVTRRNGGPHRSDTRRRQCALWRECHSRSGEYHYQGTSS